VLPESIQFEGRSGTTGGARGTGALLIAATLLEVAVMAHHPSVKTPDLAQAIDQLRNTADLAAWVHGVLIALMLVGFYALTEFSLQRGLHRPFVRAGLIGYAVGVFAMIGAASISGFVTPHVAVLAPRAGETDLRVTGQLLTLCALLNRTMASLGAVAMSAGIAAWSLDLLRGPWLGRVVGLIGILIGSLPAAALISGLLHLNVHGMMLVIVLQAAWTVGVGVLLILERRKAPPGVAER